MGEMAIDLGPELTREGEEVEAQEDGVGFFNLTFCEEISGGEKEARAIVGGGEFFGDFGEAFVW